MESSRSLSSVGVEVFSKQALSLSNEKYKAKGKQKRKERAIKPKSSSQKARKLMQHDVVRQIREKEELMEASGKENPQGQRSLVTRSRLTQKLGIYGKAKMSEPARRKPLGDIQPQLQVVARQDLPRVLGCGPLVKDPIPSPSPPRRAPSPSPPPRPASRGAEEASGSVGALPVGTDMECSPEQGAGQAHQSLREIALRLAEGLQPDLVFPGSHYLESTRAELHKLMKQCNPENFTDLVQCLNGKEVTESPPPGTVQQPLFDTPAARPHPTPPDPLSSLDMLFGGDPSPQHPPSEPHMILMALPPEPAPQEQQLVNHPLLAPPLAPPLATEVWEEAQLGSMDFLDLVDQPQHVVTLAQAPPQAPPTSSRWLPTPERPKMFPHMLY